MRAIVVLAILAAVAFAGCAKDSPAAEEGPELEVTDTTGGIRGVVVDEAIRPVADVEVKLHTGEATVTDEEGNFAWSGLEPGEYFVSASKLGYQSSQSSVTVLAGVANPPAVIVTIIFLPDQQPFVETYEMKGYYDCAMTNPGVTDSCDFAYRTAYDVANESAGQPPVIPRSPGQFHNTGYYFIAPSVTSLIEEGYWEDPQVSEMKISVDATPIDPVTDSSASYVEVDGPSPTYGRLDGEQVPGGQEVALRGFLPFGEPQVAVQFEFSIFLTLFHNYEAPEGWSFVRGDPVPF